MTVDINIDNGKYKINCNSIEEAISNLSDIAMENIREVNKSRESIKNSRCHKCLYSNMCTDIDTGDCKKYKKDSPDGGYYG